MDKSWLSHPNTNILWYEISCSLHQITTKNDNLKLKCSEPKEVCLIFLLRTLDWIKISKFNQSWFETGNFIDLERVEDKQQRFQPESNANCGWSSFNVYRKVEILQVIWYIHNIFQFRRSSRKRKISIQLSYLKQQCHLVAKFCHYFYSFSSIIVDVYY